MILLHSRHIPRNGDPIPHNTSKYNKRPTIWSSPRMLLGTKQKYSHNNHNLPKHNIMINWCEWQQPHFSTKQHPNIVVACFGPFQPCRKPYDDVDNDDDWIWTMMTMNNDTCWLPLYHPPLFTTIINHHCRRRYK